MNLDDILKVVGMQQLEIIQLRAQLAAIQPKQGESEHKEHTPKGK